MNSILINIKQIIKLVVQNENLTLDEIILFGSRATEKYNEKSDYDLLVILKNDLNHLQKSKLSSQIKITLAKELMETNLYFGSDIIIKSRQELDNSMKRNWSVTYTAFTTGKRL